MRIHFVNVDDLLLREKNIFISFGARVKIRHQEK